MFDALFNFLKLFRNIPQKDIDTISRYLFTKRVKEGEILLEESQYSRELYFIIKGVLKIVTVNTKGDNVTMFFLRENQFCSILNSFTNHVPANEGIVAATAAEMIVFSQTNLAKIYAEVPYFKTLVENITRQALMDKIALRSAYLGEDATKRYQKFLVRQSEVALRVSMNDIASYLEITPQSLSRIRRSIK